MNRIEEALARATDTKALELGAGAITRTGKMFRELFPGCRAVLISDETAWGIAGERVGRSLSEAGILQEEPLVFAAGEMRADWTCVERILRRLEGTDAVPVAVGAGVVNDLTKFCSHSTGRRYVIVGTAASMDGYTAFGATITRDGNKYSMECPAPYGAVFDSAIAAGAPASLSAAGYADLIAKIPGGADWLLADAFGVESVDEFAFSIVQDGLKVALGDPAGIRSMDVGKIERLAEGLVLSGFAMQEYRSSRPASGAEHMFSHLWDMEGLTVDGHTNSHGFQVGIGTLASTALHELLLAEPIEELDIDACVAAWKSWEETERDIREIFRGEETAVSRGLTETRAKHVDRDTLRSQLERFKAAWPALKTRLQGHIIPREEVRERLRLVGAPYEPEQIGLSRERMLESYRKLPYMRARFTIMDVAVRCNLLEKWLSRLFD